MRVYIPNFLLLLGILSSGIFHKDLSQYGTASFYPARAIGRPAAAGESINSTELTAAHKTLPFNTVVLITHLKNKKSARVRINDRGPFMENVILELSPAVAQQLKCSPKDLIQVRMDVIDMPKETYSEARSVAVNIPPTYNQNPTAPGKAPKRSTQISPPGKKQPKTSVASNDAKKISKPTAKTPSTGTTPKVNQAPANAEFSSKGVSAARIYNLSNSYAGQYAIQTGVFTTEQAAINRANALKKSGVTNVLLEITSDKKYRVIIGPYPSKTVADASYKKMRDSKKIDGYTVVIGN